MAKSDSLNQNLTDSDTDENDSLTCSSALQNINKRRRDMNNDIDDEIVRGMTASYTEISFNTQSSEPDDSILEENNVSGCLQELAAASGHNELKKAEPELNDSYKPHGESLIVRPSKLVLTDDVRLSDDSDGNLQHKALGYLNQLNGTVIQEGDMVSFVAEDLENKIKLSSPVGKSSDAANEAENQMSSTWLYRHSLVNQFSTVDIGILNDVEIEVQKIATSVDSLTENLAEILHSVSALTVDCLETYRDVVCKTCDAVDLNIKSMYQLMAKCEELSKSMKPIYKLSQHVKEIKHLLDLFENATS